MPSAVIHWNIGAIGYLLSVIVHDFLQGEKSAFLAIIYTFRYLKRAIKMF